ncbi:hypothetical protein [Undibacterium sp.]|uniref:hypothetical protein n=1 Tax=Undibacterium sp. TaxID=1914977 RepID=UPI0037506643
MNPLSLLIAPLQSIVLFFAPHAVGTKPLGMRSFVRSPVPSTAPSAAPHAAPGSAVLRTSRITYPSTMPHISAKPIHRVRVVRNIDTALPADRAGRMVVSGRFADVCAELDRLASMEMRTA